MQDLKSRRRETFRRISYFLAMLISFLLPLNKKIIPLVIILWLVFWLLQGNFKERFVNQKGKHIILLMSCFYLIHVFGLVFTDNMQSGMFDIQLKLSILVMPFLYIGNSYTRKEYNLFLLSFVAGNLLASLICFFYASYNQVFYGSGHFMYSQFSLFQHTSYFAMFLVMTMVILYYFFINKLFVRTKMQLLIYPVLIAWFAFVIYLLSAKAGMIAGFLVFAGFCIHQIYKLKSIVVKVAIILSFFAVITIAVSSNFRFRQIIVEMVTNKNSESAKEGSANARINIIKCAWELISDEPFLGVGTGDVKDCLLKKYEDKGMQRALEEKYNSHNQFVETFVGQGGIGFILLVLLFIVPMVNSIKSKNFVAASFIVILTISFLFESMLNMRTGVIFFALFSSFFGLVEVKNE